MKIAGARGGVEMLTTAENSELIFGWLEMFPTKILKLWYTLQVNFTRLIFKWLKISLYNYSNEEGV